jgi:acyl carrier protein
MKIILDILTDMHPDIDFLTNTRLIDDGLLKSMDIVGLIGEINDRLDIAIPAEEILPENFNSYTALSALVTRLLDE